ncbi:heavy metal-associated domain-containing protein [Gilvibacter sp.]|uniref:heavy-metal-associated domain-containing protein n=1 Tax=Gilvibacter sp. TaxID=2729997 RepID=UPI0025BE27A4|nr:heavy metal-associated domain-containing protein [Gilvibacter sp.]NQX78019.1 heavy-metal-associated domain-containing protein [Gilvibacter sp.]
MKTVYKVQNLRCHGCAKTISNRLERIHGVLGVKVNPEADEISLTHNNNSTLNAAIYKLSKMGYPLETATNSIDKKANALVSCAKGRSSGLVDMLYHVQSQRQGVQFGWFLGAP